MDKVKLLLLALFCFLFLESCEKKEVNTFNKELFMYGEFVNKPASKPSITIDKNKSSEEINIAKKAKARIDSNRIFMEFDNIRIEDDLGVYNIKNIITEEFREGSWERDSENFLKEKETKNLDVVLVLDVSSSLGRDVDDIKKWAKEFVKILFKDIEDPKIGIVGFSEYIDVLPLTSDETKAKNFIDNLQEDRNATKLYQAMDTGLTIIDTSITREGKSMVTFTDGRNNSWTNIKYENSNHMYNRLKSNNISSYTIGFQGKGGIDKEILKKLEINGLHKFPEEIQGVKDVFLKFANSVSSTNRLIYDRNKSPITNPIKLRFRLKTTLR